MNIIYGITGLLIGSLILFLILYPKIKNRITIDKETEVKNQQIQLDNLELTKTKDFLLDKINSLKESVATQEENVNTIYNKSMELANEKMSEAAEHLLIDYQQKEQEYQKKYLEVIEESVQEYNLIVEDKKIEILNISNQLNDLKSKAQAATEYFKRIEEDKLEENKYKLVLSELDLIEIKRLREVIPFLRQSRPVCKIIWESYYRTPTNELINRVLGANKVTGIYRIANLNTGMCYIGQAVNIADRFKQHIKCGLGIDTPQTKLYKAMLEDGVENFRFEVIEKCEQSELNDKEKYWIDFYQSKDWGYNQTGGGAKKI